MNNLPPKPPSPDHDLDADLVLEFLAHYHALEQALVRAGFTRPGRRPGVTRPDWEQFTRYIAGKFNPDSSPELAGAVYYLLGQPDVRELRRERLQAACPGELSSPVSDIFWLSESIREIRNRLLLWINFAEKSWMDEASVTAALFIVQAWSYLDPKVEGMLPHVQ